MIYCHAAANLGTSACHAGVKKNVIDTGKADFLAVHIEFSSKWNVKKSSSLFY